MGRLLQAPVAAAAAAVEIAAVGIVHIAGTAVGIARIADDNTAGIAADTIDLLQPALEVAEPETDQQLVELVQQELAAAAHPEIVEGLAVVHLAELALVLEPELGLVLGLDPVLVAPEEPAQQELGKCPYTSVHALELAYAIFALHICCSILENCHNHIQPSEQLIRIADLARHSHFYETSIVQLYVQWPQKLVDSFLASSWVRLH